MKQTPKKEEVALRRAVHVDDDDLRRRLARLKRIEGQVRGLQKMVEEDRYCPDIIAQIRSVEAALRGVEVDLVKGHLSHCASHALATGNEQERAAMVDELVELLGRR